MNNLNLTFMKTLVLLIIGVLSITVCSCHKDDSNRQGTTTGVKDTADYRTKFAGSFSCMVINTYKSDSTHIVTQGKHLVTSTIEEGSDSTMRFTCDSNFVVVHLVTFFGVVTEYGGLLSYGKFTNGGDSLYLRVYSSGHVGSNLWEVAGKKQQ
ncbi:hypothetical protein AEM51_02200 [Bacteroidetes bacterium UKL13-3]|nr:hypothetical protein AEM51_02200 [Bacteroidetes bacterium UKL13-3]HCP94441.1 hypothetical protein [Bacteroidota bacterium]